MNLWLLSVASAREYERFCLPETVLGLGTILENICSVPGKRFKWECIVFPKVNQEVHQLPSWRHQPG